MPPPSPTEVFPVTAQSVNDTISSPAKTAPPPGVDFPPVSVSPEMFTTAPAGAPLVLKTRLALLPLMMKLALPGPTIVTASVMFNSPVVNVSVPVTPGKKLIVSGPAKLFALVIAARNELSPLSKVLVTVNTAGTVRVSSACRDNRARGVVPRVADLVREQARIRRAARIGFPVRPPRTGSHVSCVPRQPGNRNTSTCPTVPIAGQRETRFREKGGPEGRRCIPLSPCHNKRSVPTAGKWLICNGGERPQSQPNSGRERRHVAGRPTRGGRGRRRLER